MTKEKPNLTPAQHAKGVELYERFGRFLPFHMTADEWMQGFASDARQVAVWEVCAETFELYKRPEGLSDKQVAARILHISTAPSNKDAYPELEAIFRARLRKHLPDESATA